MITVLEKYGITFHEMRYPGGIRLFARAESIEFAPIASHLSDSDKIDTLDQLESVEEAISGQKLIQPFWSGAIFGTFLEIHENGGLAEIGDRGTKIPIEDFKVLLKEWLAFIT